jgi:hypothetical protein
MAKKFSTKSLTKQVNKWTSGYYSSGYKSKYSTYSNSSFWLDDDFLDDDTYLDKKEKPKVDYIKLAGYKRAISNFVRIVTNKADIKVMYSSGQNSYTNGKQVVISSKLDEKEFDSTVGLALHEGSHVALTDFAFTKAALDPDKSQYIESLNHWHDQMWPDQVSLKHYNIGLKLKDLVNIIEDRRIDRFVYKSAPGYQGYYRALYDKYFNAKEIDRALLEGIKTEKTWDDYLFHIINFMNPNRQLNALPGLKEIWDLIDIPNIGRLEGTPAVFTVAIEVFKELCFQLGGLDAPEGQGNGQGESGDEGLGSGAGDDVADINEDEDTNNEMGGAGADPNLDIQGTNSSESSNNAQASQGNVDPKAAKKSKKFEKDLKEAIQKQKDFLEGKIKKKSLQKKDAEKINAASESNMSYETVGGGENNTEYWGSVKNTKCLVVKGISKVLLDSGLLSNAAYSDYQQIKAESTKYGRTDYIAEGIVLGTLLGKRLKTRDEDRNLKTTRMETGRIDRRLVAELGFGNDHVFSQTIHNTVTPSLIHISIDGSGSMMGDKWRSAMKTAVAIAKAASMIKSLDCVISVRTTQGQDPLMWVVYDSRKTSFAAIKDYLYAIHASGSTPEGLCYEAVMKDIIGTANGKDAYFINICDGEPGFSNGTYSYGSSFALNHTRDQVNKMRKAGIKVLSFFVSDGSYGLSSSREKHERMYGKEATVIDLSNLTQLSMSLNKMFVRNV